MLGGQTFLRRQLIRALQRNECRESRLGNPSKGSRERGSLFRMRRSADLARSPLSEQEGRRSHAGIWRESIPSRGHRVQRPE